MKGTVYIGFDVNRREKFVVSFQDKVVIGAYNCTFNKKTIFVYKAKSDVSGYMLRKFTWLSLMNDFGGISEYFRQNIEFNYLNQIKYKVLL